MILAQTGGAFISLHDVSFRLGEELVFQGTRWYLKRNQHWLLTGANGSGKSLLAQAFLGRIPAVGGELQYHFRPRAGMLPEQAIGYVSFEERKADLGEVILQSRWNSLEEEQALTVRELLEYERVMDINPFEVRGNESLARRAHENRVRRAVRLLKIEPFMRRTLLSLSNGETQRVELAKVLCRPLRLLILDEPYAGLDSGMRRYVESILEHLMGSSLRIMVITTRLEDLPPGCLEDLPPGLTHAAVVDQCRLVAEGTCEDVLPRLRRRKSRMSTNPGLAFPLFKQTGRKAVLPSNSVRALVRIKDLTLQHGQRVLFKQFNWEIHAGQSWALIGPNGSGKTTLLSLIAGDHPQAYASGLEVFGRRRGSGESIWDLKRQIGWLSPELQFCFDVDMTCAVVVGSGFHETIGLFEPLSPAQRRATIRLMDQFGLGAQADAPLGSLSPGWQRLVLLARAVVKRPKLLIADEACQGLDLRNRRLVIEALDQVIRSHSTTVIFASHRSDELPPGIAHIMRLGDQDQAEAASRKKILSGASEPALTYNPRCLL